MPFFREKYPPSQKNLIMASQNTKTRVSGSDKEQRGAFVDMQRLRQRIESLQKRVLSPNFKLYTIAILSDPAQASTVEHSLVPISNCLAIMLTLQEMIVIGALIGPGLLVAACGMSLALGSLLLIWGVFGNVAYRVRLQ